MHLGHDNAKAMLSELLTVEQGLSDWEVNFVENLSHWDGDFTPKQLETLERVWEKATDGQPVSRHW